MHLKERTYLVYISILRIYIGYYLLNQGIRKFQRGFPKRDWIAQQIGDLHTLDLYPWYKAFLQNFVVPHREFFGQLVTFGEIAVGTCLLFGFMTRLGAFFGLIMMGNYYLGPGTARGGALVAQQQTFMVSLIIILLANPGRTLGLDGLLFRGRSGGAR